MGMIIAETGEKKKDEPAPNAGTMKNIFLWACLMTLCAGILAVLAAMVPFEKRRK